MPMTRDQILSIEDLEKQEVHIPEWNDSVYVRALTGGERDQLERMIAKDDISRASIAVLCVVDEAGNRLFTDKDVEALAGKHGGALEKIVSAAMAFNLMTDESLKEAGND